MNKEQYIATDYVEPERLVNTWEKKTLTLKEYAAILQLGPTSASRLTVEDSQDGIAYQTNMQLRRIATSILSDRIVDDSYTATYTYNVYKSPWQHFKALYMPAWFKYQFPVQSETKSGEVEVKFDRFALYPKANVELQRDQRFFTTYLGGFETIHDEVKQVR